MVEYKVIFLQIIFLIYQLKCESQNLLIQEYQDIDSSCVVIYDGKEIPKPLLAPKYPTETDLEFEERLKKQDEKIHKLIGEVDTYSEMNWFSTKVVDNNRLFNPTIIWESKKCLNKVESVKLLKILNNHDVTNPSSPAMCFFPKHGIFFYKDGKIERHFEICFECSRTKMNSEVFMKDVDYKLLKRFMRNNQVPLFENRNEFEEYKENYKKK